MERGVCLVQTTLPGDWLEPIAAEWATCFVRDKLASCVHRNLVTSVYHWDGSLESSDEWRIQLKTSINNKDKLVSEIQKRHPFDTPQILAWLAESTDEYASWVEG